MRWDVREGMRVFTAEGVRLGTVVGCGEETFEVEGGLLRAREYVARYGDVVTVRGEEVHLGLLKDEVSPGPGAAREAARARRPESLQEGALGQPGEWVLPLAREEATPRTTVHQVGQLRVHKVVRTEVRHFSIPVRREELVVERVAVDDADGAGARAVEGAVGPGGAAFEEVAFVIPLREERVTFTKEAHVWQEVAISRATVEEVRLVHTTVRRETAEVEERGEVPHEGPPGGLHS